MSPPLIATLQQSACNQPIEVAVEVRSPACRRGPLLWSRSQCDPFGGGHDFASLGHFGCCGIAQLRSCTCNFE